MTAPTAGSGPTHPPGHPGTGGPPPPPPPTKGHLPPGVDCDCGHGDLPQTFHLAPCPQARPLRLPTLGMVIRDAERTLRQAIATLGRQWDPTSGPQQDGGVLPSVVDVNLGAAVDEARWALGHLADIASLGLPPVGSAVQYPGPSDSRSSLSGGSASHLTAPSVAVSGGRTPGLVDAAASDPGGTDGSGAAAPSRDAGADFTLPVTERFTMPGTERIARSINEALTGQSW